MKRLFSVVLMFSCATFLSACSGPVVYKEFFGSGYSHNEIIAFTGNKDMKLIVIGNPYQTDNKEFFDIIASSMTGKNPGLPIRFTDTPVDAPNAPLRAIVQFNPVKNAIGRTMCGEELPAPSENGLPDTAMFTLCKNTSEFSTVWLKFPEGAKPGDEDFAFAIGTATRILFKRNPDPKGGEGSTCLLGSC